MKDFQEMIQGFCTSCIVGGIVLRLFSGSASHKCIKAVVGLYILTTLVRLLQQTAIPEPVLPQTTTSAASSMQHDFESTVLNRGKNDLEQYAEQALYEQGIDANVSLVLKSTPAGVYVERVFVIGADGQQQSSAAACLHQLLQPDVILFQENE